jgi:hypothetical protein
MRPLAGWCLIALMLTACANGEDQAANQGSPSQSPQETEVAKKPDITAIISANSAAILGLEDVVAIGQARCNDQPCIRVLLASDNSETRAKLPAKIDGVPVSVEVSGAFRAN